MRYLKILILIPIYLFSFIIFIILKSIRPIIKVRFGQVKSSRIGHFLINTELYLLGKKMSNKNFYDIIYFDEIVSNLYLEKIWRKKILIFPRIYVSKIHNINRFLFKDTKFEIPEFGPDGDRDKKNLLSKFPCDLKFSDEEIKYGEKLLNEIGVSEEKKIVLFCLRDSAYLKEKYPNKNFQYHNYRDWNSDDFIYAADKLAEKNYQVLRMGKIVDKDFISTNANVFDYANSKINNDFMDFYLAYKSSFCITTATGMDTFSFYFRKKFAQIHLPLFSSWTNNNNLISSCNMYLKKEKKVLNISEMFHYFNKVNFNINTNSLSDLGIQVLYHDKNHLVDFCLEAEGLYNNTYLYSDHDKDLQKKFWDVFNDNIKKYNLSYLHGNINATFDINFLRKNKKWLN